MRKFLDKIRSVWYSLKESIAIRYGNAREYFDSKNGGPITDEEALLLTLETLASEMGFSFTAERSEDVYNSGASAASDTHTLSVATIT